MDLNVFPPNNWVLEDGPYELANHVIASETKVLVLLNSWLDSEKGRAPLDHLATNSAEEEEEEEEEEEAEADWSTSKYWAARLRPLWVSEVPAGGKEGDETVVVICNRTGKENGITFAGSSCVFKMVRGSGKPKLHQIMGKREEGCQIWTV